MLTAGATVPGGYYFDRDGLDLVAIGGPEGVLPGDGGQRYQRVPTWAALLVAPVLGAACVVVIPLLAIVRFVLRMARAGWSGASMTGRASLALFVLGRRAVVGIVARLRRRSSAEAAPPSQRADDGNARPLGP